MIHLERIGGGSAADILALRVAENQRNFVAPNDRSLIEAYICLSHGGRVFPFGIYDGDTPVGFCMIGYGTDDDWTDAPAVAAGNYNLWRFMIDERRQGQGLGRAALRAILEFIRSRPCGPAALCWLSYEPENAAARALYASFGFRETGERDGDEVIAVLPLEPEETAVRCVTEADRDFWFSLDRHLSADGFARKVRDRTGYVLTADGQAAGILRWSLFWDSIPFCGMLQIVPGKRRRGFGRALAARWERDMAERGHDLALTSTQADEDAQHFWRALGYSDCGALTLPFPGHFQPTELILGKQL